MAFVFFARAVLSLVGGLLLSLAFPPVGVWPLVLALAPLIILTANSLSARAAFWPGFFFGLGFFALYLLWLPESFAPYSGGFFWLLYPPLIAVLGVFWGVVTFTARLLGGRGVGTLWLLPALWVLMEWARTQGPFAFPWGVLGYAWVGTSLAQAADLAGVYGLSLLTLVTLSLLVSPLVYRPPRALTRSRSFRAVPVARPKKRLAWTVGLLITASWLGYGLVRIQSVTLSAPKTALLVQGSTDPYARVTDPGSELDLYRRLTRRAVQAEPQPVDVVVWPEGVALGLLYYGYDLTSPYAAPERERIQWSAGGRPLITGGGAIDDREIFSASNSVFGLSNAHITGRYDKVYLVPFGEYFPLLGPLEPVYRMIFGWFGYPLLQSRPPGQTIAPLSVAGTSVAAYICYESVFPQIARTMVAKGAQVLVNISNDAWFGFGQGARQHFSMGNLRAVETRRYLLRDGNDGITAVINPLGHVEAELPRGERAALTVHYGERRALTPYVRFGDLLVLGLALAVPVIAILRRRGSSRATPA